MIDYQDAGGNTLTLRNLVHLLASPSLSAPTTWGLLVVNKTHTICCCYRVLQELFFLPLGCSPEIP